MLKWIKNYTPVNTTTTYGVYETQYLKFTATFSLPPKSKTSLSAFMRHALETRRLSRSTLVDVIPSAVNNLFKFDTNPLSTDTNGASLLKATKTTIRRLTGPSVSKLPVLKTHLEQMVQRCTASPQDVRDMFMLLLMFVGFLRESEAVALKASNVWVQRLENGSDALYVVIKKSKTDQFGENATIVVASQPGSNLCPVMWYKAHTARRAPTSTFLFHSVVPHSVGKPLAKATSNHTIKRWLTHIGVDPRPFGSHSLRRGGTTAAAKAKVRMHVIQRHGRWKSDAVYLYVVDALEERLSVSTAALGN